VTPLNATARPEVPSVRWIAAALETPRASSSL
jgi:hypothetical protein